MKSLGTRWIAALAGLFALVAAQPARAQTPSLERDPVIAAAGDIACDPEDPSFNAGAGTVDRCRQRQTSDLLLGLDLAAVLPLGDTQYEDGVLWKFQQSYDLSWGRVKSISRPVIGNHEYFVDGGAGYFDYFNGTGNFSGPAGDRDKGYYSYDIGEWHLVALNSQCSAVGGCGPGSAQEQWLRADLAANRRDCTLAYFHHPLVSSGGPGWPSVQPLWRALQDFGVDVVLAGHAHQYERYAPLDASGGVDTAQGIRFFIVGTGGKNLARPRAPAPGNEALSTGAFGVLQLTLRSGRYDWRFLRESGELFRDSGSAACQAPPAPRVPDAVTGQAGSVRGTAARLNGAVDGRGQPTTYRFEYGPTTAYGASTSEIALPQSPAGPLPVSARIAGLRRGGVYNYRVVSTNASGTVAGENRVLVADERSAYADAVDRTPGVQSHWRLGDLSGGLAVDSLGRGIGTYSGAYALSQRGAPYRDPDTAASFDGSTAFLRLYAPPVGRRFSFEGWFRWTGGPVLFRDDSAGRGYYLRDSSGRLSYRMGGTVFRTRRATAQVQDGAWHHVAITKDGDWARLFIDGVLVHEGGGAGDTPPTMPWYVMRNGPFEDHSQGVADDVAAYDRPLSRQSVTAHYRAGVRRAAPDTILARAPSGAINGRNPRFRVRSTRRRSTVRCALNAARSGLPAIVPCRSSILYPNLPDGSYVFRAYTVDSRGYADPTPARTKFRVDTVTPAADVIVPPRRLRRLIRHGLPFTLSCSESCSSRTRLELRGTDARRLRLSRGRAVEIARLEAGLRRAGSRRLRLRLRLSPVARKRLLRRRALRVTLRMSARDAAGNVRSVRRDLRFRR